MTKPTLLSARPSAGPVPFALAVALLLVSFAGLGGCGGDAGSKDNPQEGITANELLDDARADIRVGAYADAVRRLTALEIYFPFSEQTRLGQLDLMFAYQRNKQTEEALETADKFIRENPRHPRVDYAYYMRGLAYFPPELGPLEKLFKVDPASRPMRDAQRSFDNFALLIEKFPESEWAGDAQQRMIHLRNSMAAYEVYVARYYIRRNAWAAAASRGQAVIEKFQGTPAVNDALEIMIRSYRELGLPELAADAERVLAENRQR